MATIKETQNINASGNNETNADQSMRRPQNAKMEIHNLIIVDESGSMSHLRRATLSGINETMNTIRQAQKDFGDKQTHFLTLVTFDSSGSERPDVRTLIDDAPITEVGKFKDYNPCGCTPLYDAVGQSLTRLFEKIKDIEDATAVVTILTDGYENSSHEWNAASLRFMIEELKEAGWTFSYMGSAHDVQEVTINLSIDNVVEFSHDECGAANTWERESSSKRAYFSKMACEFNASESLEEKRIRRRRYNSEYYSPRVTPETISYLEDNEIFVFGSNHSGTHSEGSARYAKNHFGAIVGQAEGRQGSSYAIPTSGSRSEMKEAVKRFIDYAAHHLEKRFLVTRVGCGKAGHSIQEVAEMFNDAVKLENVTLPREFWDALGLNMF